MKVIAFDVFGTVFDLSSACKDDLRAYANHISKPEWTPLALPKAWENLPPHIDSAQGIEMLRERYCVVTCSNGPLGLLAKMSKNAKISWDAIIPLELNKVFKPNPKAYMTICEVLGVAPEDVTMVTANRHFGDLEASSALGMKSQLIRDYECPTIIHLAQIL